MKVNKLKLKKLLKNKYNAYECNCSKKYKNYEEYALTLIEEYAHDYENIDEFAEFCLRSWQEEYGDENEYWEA